MAVSEAVLRARPWLKSYPPVVPPELDMAKIGTIAGMIREQGVRHADKPAFESFGVSRTYAEVFKNALAVTRWLQDQGFVKGDRIAMMMPNIMAYPVAMFGALLGGYVIVNVNPLYTPRELTHQLKDSGARAIFVIENFANTVEESLREVKLDRVVIASAGDLLGFKGAIVNFVSRYIKKLVPKADIPGALRFGDVVATDGAPAAVAIDREDLAFLQYTGGTTGVAKGAMLSHRNILANLEQVTLWMQAGLKGDGKQPVLVTALPLYHIFALTCCCFYMLAEGGQCLLIANPRDLTSFIKTLASRRFTIFAGVNTLYNALANHPDIGKVDFSSLIYCAAGGMAMQQAVAKRWREVSGRPVIEGYGLSETSPVVSVNSMTLAEFSGTIGFPLPSTDVAIRTAEGADAAPGSPGELCVRGPQVMKGYWNQPGETAKAMTADGYFRTGDVAVMLPDGQFKIVDRMKDMVLVSGFNVYPNEVEDVIAGCPGVLEVAVIGLPDKHSGESVAAYIVKKDPGLTAEAVRAHCEENLTPYKVPRRIEFRDSLPKTNVGKVLRRVLRDEVMPKEPVAAS